MILLKKRIENLADRLTTEILPLANDKKIEKQFRNELISKLAHEAVKTGMSYEELQNQVNRRIRNFDTLYVKWLLKNKDRLK